MFCTLPVQSSAVRRCIFRNHPNFFYVEFCKVLQLEIPLVVVAVHVVALGSVRDCTTDGRDMYIYRA